MKTVSLVLGALILLLTLVAIPRSSLFAAADAICISEPPSGPVGTVFEITCTGYTPNVRVYAYIVEPSGAAGPLFGDPGSLRANEQGSISYEQASRFENATLGTGTWHFVAEELGLAHAVIHRGETSFRVTGGTEGVSGASLTAEPSVIHKPEQGYSHLNTVGLHINFFNSSDPVTIRGSGFAPGEIVSFWVEPPRGACSSMTDHLKADAAILAPGIGGLYQHVDINLPRYDGLGAVAFDNVKADAGGDVSTPAFFTMIACEGNWHFVARGNASHAGGDTFVTVAGNAVETDAWLSANPGTVTAMFDHVVFTGSGYGANERVSCWLTTPQGQTLGFPDLLFAEFSNSTQYQRTTPILSDTGGNLSFDMVTGSFYEKIHQTLVLGGSSGTFDRTFTEPVASEGALGEYAMSCRGNASGATGIARFTVTGGLVDP